MDTSSIINSCSEFVRMRTALDVDEDKLQLIQKILDRLQLNNVHSEVLKDEKTGKAVAVLGKLGNPTLPALCLNACGDTAPVGNLNDWNCDPFGGTISDGRLYGRGAADSKIAIAMFLEMMQELSTSWESNNISLHVLIDLDEHTGEFGGAKQYVRSQEEIYGMYIGYPGPESINVGARGVYRSKISVNGIGQHSGSSAEVTANPIQIAAKITNELSSFKESEYYSEHFPKVPRVSVTDIEAHGHYTTIPTTCILGLDVRMTPTFEEEQAKEYINSVVESVLSESSESATCRVEDILSWPPYRLDVNLPFVQMLAKCAKESFNQEIPTRIVGPSNIGNYLFSQDCNAICGFGVEYGNMHAPNEYIELSSVRPVYEAYKNAVTELAKTSG